MPAVVDFFEVVPVAIRLCGPNAAEAGSVTVVLGMVPVEEAVREATVVVPTVRVTRSPCANPLPAIVNPAPGATNRVDVESFGAVVLGSTVKVERAAVATPSSAERSAMPLALTALARTSNRPPPVPTGTVTDQLVSVVPGAVRTAGLG